MLRYRVFNKQCASVEYSSVGYVCHFVCHSSIPLIAVWFHELQQCTVFLYHKSSTITEKLPAGNIILWVTLIHWNYIISNIRHLNFKTFANETVRHDITFVALEIVKSRLDSYYIYLYWGNSLTFVTIIIYHLILINGCDD